MTLKIQISVTEDAQPSARESWFAHFTVNTAQRFVLFEEKLNILKKQKHQARNRPLHLLQTHLFFYKKVKSQLTSDFAKEYPSDILIKAQLILENTPFYHRCMRRRVML